MRLVDWRIEAVYQESKQQLGLGQYQGRLYPGLQHHLSAVICTYAFLVAERERNVSLRYADHIIQ